MPRRLLAILFFALLVRIGFALSTPPWEAPDELAHFNYVQTLATQHALPVMGDDAWETHHYEDYQAPLAYIGMAPFLVIFKQAGLDNASSLLGLRLLSAVLSLAIIILTWRCQLALDPARPQVALAAASVPAFLPTFVNNSCTVNNDILLYFWCMLALTWMCESLRRASFERSRAIGLGLVLACALYTKSSAFLMLPVGLAFACLMGRRTRSRRASGLAVASVCMALLLAAPWSVRSIRLYDDPTGVLKVNKDLTRESGSLQQRLLKSTEFLFPSFWANFGRLNEINAPWTSNPFYARKANVIFECALLIGVVGLGLRTLRAAQGVGQRKLEDDRLDKRIALLMAFAAMVFLIATYLYVRPHGRYLFPVIGAWASGLSEGWAVWLGERVSWIASMLFFFDMYFLFVHIRPHYV